MTTLVLFLIFTNSFHNMIIELQEYYITAVVPGISAGVHLVQPHTVPGTLIQL